MPRLDIRIPRLGRRVIANEFHFINKLRRGYLKNEIGLLLLLLAHHDRYTFLH